MITNAKTLTQADVRHLFDYDPATGVLSWKNPPGTKVKRGQEAGGFHLVCGKSYRSVGIQGQKFLTHRLIWLWVKGSFPTEQIDHIDGDGLNNIWSNIRAVSRQDNQRNMRLFTTNTSGVVGVHFARREGKWLAYIKINYKFTHLGYFDDFFDAVSARKAAEVKHDFHLNHGQVRPL